MGYQRTDREARQELQEEARRLCALLPLPELAAAVDLLQAVAGGEGDQGERCPLAAPWEAPTATAATARRHLRALGMLTGHGRRRTPDPLPAGCAWELLRLAVEAWTVRGVDPGPLYLAGILGHVEGLGRAPWRPAC